MYSDYIEESSYCESQVNMPAISISKLLPANQILSQKQYTSSEQVKWKVVSKQIKQKKRNSKVSKKISEQVITRINFSQDQGLGYQYESFLRQKIIYGRILKNIDFQSWKTIKTYTSKTLKQNKSNKIQYLSGLFHPISSLQNCDSNPKYSIHNNLPFITAQQYNTNHQKIAFTSDYQSANLYYAFQKANSEYDLIMHSDTNSKGSTQWFNFQAHLKKKGYYRFNIVNFTKSASLYNKGMGVVVRYQDGIYGRINCDLNYKDNQIPIQDSGPIPRYYKTLSFTFICQSEQKVKFSYGYPYCLQTSQEFWNNVISKIQQINKQNNLKQGIRLSKKVIGYTKAGFQIYGYIIKQIQKIQSIKHANGLHKNYCKKSIVFMARQHPGQTQSSFIIQGIVNYLLTNLEQIRSSGFIFYFIPLVNVQGIQYGNYRTNGSGIDLNRNWKNCSKISQPQVCAVKAYLSQINQLSPIKLLIDLHGHSKSFNSFFYGVKKVKNNNNMNVKAFPYFCSKKSAKFSYQQSSFQISENKKNTARAVLSAMFPSALVYTLQNSFYGYKNNETINQYTPSQLKKVGEQLISYFLQFSRLFKSELDSEKLSLQKQLIQFQKKIKKDKESYDSDSEAELQLDLSQQVNVITKKDISKTERNKPITKSKMQFKTNEKYVKKQGRYLKTIQMMDGRDDQKITSVLKQINNQPKRREGIQRTLRPVIYLKKRQQQSVLANTARLPSANESSRLICINSLRLDFVKKETVMTQPQTEKFQKKNRSKRKNFVTFINEKEYKLQNYKQLQNRHIDNFMLSPKKLI